MVRANGVEPHRSRYLDELLDEWASEVHKNKVNITLSRLGFCSLPSFSGFNPYERVELCEKFFEINPSLEVYKYSLMVDLLVSKARVWFNSWSVSSNEVDWEEFIAALYIRFEHEEQDEKSVAESCVLENSCDPGSEHQLGLVKNSVSRCEVTNLVKQDMVDVEVFGNGNFANAKGVVNGTWFSVEVEELHDNAILQDKTPEVVCFDGACELLTKVGSKNNESIWNGMPTAVILNYNIPNLRLQIVKKDAHSVIVKNGKDDLIAIMVFDPEKRINKATLNLKYQYQLLKCFVGLQDCDYFDVKSKPPDDFEEIKEVELSYLRGDGFGPTTLKAVPPPPIFELLQSWYLGEFEAANKVGELHSLMRSNFSLEFQSDLWSLLQQNKNLFGERWLQSTPRGDGEHKVTTKQFGFKEDPHMGEHWLIDANLNDILLQENIDEIKSDNVGTAGLVDFLSVVCKESDANEENKGDNEFGMELKKTEVT